MAIKVQFPIGESTATVKGLFQWDYGQTLEIECAEIGSEILEVHFACHNMNEAVVRVCSFSNGVGTVEIPDECLEQTSAVTAWVYKVDGTQGHTIKTITLPITARTRPNKNRDIAEKYVDEYGQLIEEVNEAVDALEKGDVTVAKANEATTAGHANTAGSAQNATYATSAGSAQNATYATSAGSAGFATPPLVETCAVSNGCATANKLRTNEAYLVLFEESNACSSGVCVICSGEAHSSAIGMYNLLIRNEDIYLSLDGTVTGNGTLKFYILGGLS